MTVTIKRAKEWLANLPVEDMRAVNSQYNDYASSTSVIYRMGKNEWLLNHYYEHIESWTLSLEVKSNEEQGTEDTADSKAAATMGEKETAQTEETTRDEDVSTPIDEAQKKMNMVKIALAFLSAGAIWLLI